MMPHVVEDYHQFLEHFRILSLSIVEQQDFVSEVTNCNVLLSSLIFA